MTEKEIEMMKKRGLAELEAMENIQRNRLNSELLRTQVLNPNMARAGSRFSEDASYIALAISIIALLIAFYPSDKGKSSSPPLQASTPASPSKVEEGLSDLSHFRKATEEELAKVRENLTQLRAAYQDTTKQVSAFEPRLTALGDLSSRLDTVRNQLAQMQAELNRIASDIRTEQIQRTLLQTQVEATRGAKYRDLTSHLQEIRQMALRSNLSDKEKIVKDLDALLAKENQGEGLILSKLEGILKDLNAALEIK